MIALGPYEILIKVATVGALASALFIGGCVHGKKAQAAKDQAALVKASGELNDCSGSLSAASRRFEEIDAATKLAKQTADQRTKQAQQDEQQAINSQRVLGQQLADLKKQSDEDKKTCSIEEARICGSVLR